MKKYFKNGEQVKLIEDDGCVFDVKIVDLVCDYYGDGKMYYVVEPIGFKSFTRTVPCEHCHKI